MDKERTENIAKYHAKRIYTALVEISRDLHDAKQAKADLGELSKLDMAGLIAEAKKFGEIPDWTAEGTPVGGFRGKELTTVVWGDKK